MHGNEAELPEGPGEEESPHGDEVEKKAYHVKKGGLTDYRRSAPFWIKLKTAEKELVAQDAAT